MWANTTAREHQRISLRTNLEVLISFDLIITASIMQSVDESVSVSVDRNGHRGADERERESGQIRESESKTQKVRNMAVVVLAGLLTCLCSTHNGLLVVSGLQERAATQPLVLDR